MGKNFWKRYLLQCLLDDALRSQFYKQPMTLLQPGGLTCQAAKHHKLFADHSHPLSGIGEKTGEEANLMG